MCREKTPETAKTAKAMTLSSSRRRASRQAQEDRKRKPAAEDVILETKLAPPKKSKGSPAADTARKRHLARRQPSPCGRRRKGYDTAATTAAATNAVCDRISDDNGDVPAPSDPRQGSRRSDRDGSSGNGSEDNSTRGREDDEDSVQGGVSVREGRGAGEHELLVDVTRRPARAVRKYAEEELDRFCESSVSSTITSGWWARCDSLPAARRWRSTAAAATTAEMRLVGSRDGLLDGSP